MKKLLIMLMMGVAVGATAQPKIGGGFRTGGAVRGGFHGGYTRPRVTVVAPAYPYYGGLGYGLGFGYSPFYNPYGPYQRYQSRPNQLDLAIEDIKNEYSYKISNVKDDKSLSKDERKQQVKELKYEKENAINDAKKDYYAEKDRQREQRNSNADQQQ